MRQKSKRQQNHEGQTWKTEIKKTHFMKLKNEIAFKKKKFARLLFLRAFVKLF